MKCHTEQLSKSSQASAVIEFDSGQEETRRKFMLRLSTVSTEVTARLEFRSAVNKMRTGLELRIVCRGKEEIESYI